MRSLSPFQSTLATPKRGTRRATKSGVYRRTGNDLRLAQEFLGHASPLTTAIYVHIVEDDLMRAVDATRLGRCPVRELPAAQSRPAQQMHRRMAA